MLAHRYCELLFWRNHRHDVNDICQNKLQIKVTALLGIDPEDMKVRRFDTMTEEAYPFGDSRFATIEMYFGDLEAYEAAKKAAFDAQDAEHVDEDTGEDAGADADGEEVKSDSTQTETA